MRNLAWASCPEVAPMAVIVSVAAVIAMVILSGCGSSGPDLAACKAAMQAQYARALADPSAPSATRPAACKGVPDELSLASGSRPEITFSVPGGRTLARSSPIPSVVKGV